MKWLNKQQEIEEEKESRREEFIVGVEVQKGSENEKKKRKEKNLEMLG